MASTLAPLAALLLLLATAAAAAGSCPDREAKADFDQTAFMGTWYMQKVVQTPGYANTKCNHLKASLGENDEITLNIMYYNTTSSKDTHVVATLRKADAAAADAKYTYYREGVFSHDKTSFKIVNTDYTGYAVVSFCDLQRDLNTVFLLTRKRSPAEDEMKAAEAALPADLTYVTQDQADCPEHDH
ncbi:lazarillo protein-like [Bacillus rossius redtenbacheri]|uniref:lazarillo protein-like n=1 Tax=Bacillus rossius redtenbacheri TaxID=93214 RepID=UPI002FDDC777